MPWHRLVRRDDDFTQRARSVLIKAGQSREQVDQFVRLYFDAMNRRFGHERQRTTGDPVELYVWVYDNERLLRSGNGQWVAMAQGRAGFPGIFSNRVSERGTENPTAGGPARTTRVPSVQASERGTENPTARERYLYGETMSAFTRDPPEGPEDESRIMRQVARRNGISVREIERAFDRVAAANWR